MISPEEFFALEEGRAWFFDVEHGFNPDTTQWTLDSVLGQWPETLRILSWDGGAGQWLISDSGVAETLDIAVAGDTFLVGATKAVPLGQDTVRISQMLPYGIVPLEVGKSWATPETLIYVGDVDGDGVVDSIYYHMSATVLAQEEITTFRGREEAVKVLYVHYVTLPISRVDVRALEERIWWIPRKGPGLWAQWYLKNPDSLLWIWNIKHLVGAEP